MKKLIMIMCTLFLLTGCGQQEKQQKEQLEIASRAYYETYGIQYDVDEYTVTLKQLVKANKELKQNYDLSKVEKCSDDTKVSLTIKNKKVQKVEIKLNCNH